MSSEATPFDYDAYRAEVLAHVTRVSKPEATDLERFSVQGLVDLFNRRIAHPGDEIEGTRDA